MSITAPPADPSSSLECSRRSSRTAASGVADSAEDIQHLRERMSASGTVLVTGASGFVGSAVARKLVACGFPVRVMVRPTSLTAHLGHLGLDFVEGDLRDPDAVRRAIDGVRWVFHVAADYRLWARNPFEIVDNNVRSTRNVMEAAREAGVARIVYTSSAATVALGHNGVPVDEQISLKECDAVGAYKRSKVLAEQVVAGMAAEGLPVVILNPTAPIGPYDVRPTPTGRLILQAASGRMPGYVDTGLNFVHVDDVAAAHVAALERGRLGERYLVGGQNVLLSALLAEVARQVGRRPPRVRLPRSAVMPLAYSAEALAHLTGREPFVTRDGLRMSKKRMFFITTKAEQEFGIAPRPYAEAVADAIRWFKDAGYFNR